MELDLHPGHLAPESLLLTTTLFNTNSQVTLCEVLQCGLITISFSHPTPFVFDLSANPVGSTFRTYPESNLSSPHPLLPPPLLAWTTVVASSLLPPLPPPQVCPHSCQRVLVQPKSAHGPPLLRPLLHLSQRKSQSPPRGQRGPTEPGPVTSPTSPPATCASLTLIPLHWSPHSTSNVPRMLLPQGLCTGFSPLSGLLSLDATPLGVTLTGVWILPGSHSLRCGHSWDQTDDSVDIHEVTRFGCKQSWGHTDWDVDLLGSHTRVWRL